MANALTVNAEQAIDIITEAVLHNLSLPDDAEPKDRHCIMLMGPPGCGKSYTAKYVVDRVREMGHPEFMQAPSVLCPSYDPAEITGFPGREGRTQFRCRPDWLPEDGEGIIYFEEMGQANKIQQAIYTPLFYDWMLGQHEMGPGWTPIICSNRRGDKGGAGDVISIIYNRVTTLYVIPDTTSFSNYAIANKLDGAIPAFIRFKEHGGENILFTDRPETAAFPSPRAWERSSRWLKSKALTDSCLRAALAGTVGEAIASTFLEYRNTVWRKVPSYKEIIANPHGVEIHPDNPGLMFAVIGWLAGQVTRKDMGPACAYVERSKSETWMAYFLSDIKRRGDKGLIRTKEWTKWAADVLVSGTV